MTSIQARVAGSNHSMTILKVVIFLKGGKIFKPFYEMVKAVREPKDSITYFCYKSINCQLKVYLNV